MTSDIDQPRQRTVAELLAEHGGGAPTGRRRRRRADEAAAVVESDPMPPAAAAPPAPAPGGSSGERAPAAAVASVWNAPPPATAVPAAADAPVGSGMATGAPAGPDAPAEPDRSQTAADEPATAAEPPPTAVKAPAPARTVDAPVFGPAPAGDGQPVEWPTEQIPLIGGTYPHDVGTRDVGNGPIDRLRRATPKWRDALDAVERSERELRNGHGGPSNGHAPTRPPAARDEVDDGGPLTQAAPLDPDFRAPAGLDPADFARPAELNGHDAGRLDELPTADDQDDHWPDEADEGGRNRADHDRAGTAQAVEDGSEPDLEPRRRLGRTAAAATGPSWTVVLAQWIGGAIGGAALWIGFRFLWRSLPVVAFAASILITIGLVLLVRALMRNDGRRTTVFVVLVGLLLTVSPAILVLLDR
jgi:hypothetical protein